MKTYPALAFEHKDESGVYIGEFEGWCQDLDEAYLQIKTEVNRIKRKLKKSF
ncbi:TPA: hypothetical protein SLA12_001581 [Staphylococcus aureus]|nr:hypothetical protein [Staphylococcus aureus]